MVELQPQPPRPRPRLPWDVLALIFEASEPSSLATLGKVSCDFLFSTSAVLYGSTVEIKSLEALRLLFCERKNNSTASRISSLLSLSQIETLNLNLISISTSSIPSRFKPIALSSSRLSSSTPLPLTLFTLNLQLEHRTLLHQLHLHLFPLLNPSRVNLAILNRPSQAAAWYSIGDDVPPLVQWTRTRRVDVRGLIHSSRFRGQSYVLGLSLPSVYSPRRLIRIHVEETMLYEGSPTVASYLAWFELSPLGPKALDHMVEGSVVLVATTEEGRKQAEEAREGFKDGWKEKFEVVLES